MNISVLILTYNEASNLPGCLSSVSFSDDIIVVDSGSSDSTAAIATEAGAKVLYREFDNYAAQRNFGLGVDFKHEWILMLDADERLTHELLAELERVVLTKGNQNTLYRMRRKDMFMGRWLKHSSGYPTWFGRLFRKGMVRVEREINEEYHTGGGVGLLQGHLVHYPFNKGLHYWFERHNRYSTMEAERLIGEQNFSVSWVEFFASDPMLRRKAFKQLVYRLPFRSVLAFFYLFVLRLGFLDGLPGLHFSLMRASYEFMISMKIRELKRTEKGFPV